MNRLIDPELLRAFVAVIDAGGLKPAAEQLNRTPSAISMQLKRLEEQLGRQLLRRSNRGIALTDAGRTLQGYAAQLLQLNASTLSALRRDALRGKLQLGVPADYLPQFLQHFLPALRERFPELAPRITSEPSRLLRQRVHSGDIDLAFVTREPDSQEGELLWRESLSWWYPAHGTLAQGIPSEERLPLALLSADCVLRDLALQTLKRRGVDYEVVLSSSALSAVTAAVRAGLAVALLPQSSVGEADGLRPGHPLGLDSLESLSVGLIHSPAVEAATASAIAELARSAIRLS